MLGAGGASPARGRSSSRDRLWGRAGVSATTRWLACRLGLCRTLSATGSAEGTPTGHTERHEVRQRDLPAEGIGKLASREDGSLVDGDEDGSHDEGCAHRAPQERSVAGGAVEAVASTPEVVRAAGEAAPAARAPHARASRAHERPQARLSGWHATRYECNARPSRSPVDSMGSALAYSSVATRFSWALRSRIHSSWARAKSAIACGPATASPRSNAAGSLQR